MPFLFRNKLCGNVNIRQNSANTHTTQIFKFKIADMYIHRRVFRKMSEIGSSCPNISDKNTNFLPTGTEICISINTHAPLSCLWTMINVMCWWIYSFFPDCGSGCGYKNSTSDLLILPSHICTSIKQLSPLTCSAAGIRYLLPRVRGQD